MENLEFNISPNNWVKINESDIPELNITDNNSDTEDEKEYTKEDANKYVTEGKYMLAIDIYNKLLEEDNIDSYILLSNRGLCYFKLNDYELSLKDLVKSTKKRPDYAKAWGRLGATLYKLNKLDKAHVAYTNAYTLEEDTEKLIIYKNMIDIINRGFPKNIHNIKDSIKETIEGKLHNLFSNNNDMMNNMVNNMMENVFSNSNIMEKIINPEFQNKVLSMQSNPFNAINDPDIMNVITQMIGDMKR